MWRFSLLIHVLLPTSTAVPDLQPCSTYNIRLVAVALEEGTESVPGPDIVIDTQAGTYVYIEKVKTGPEPLCVLSWTYSPLYLCLSQCHVRLSQRNQIAVYAS